MDEADRMLERSHFSELTEILALLSECGGGSGGGAGIDDEESGGEEEEEEEEEGSDEEEEEREEEEKEEVFMRQTVVVSATLTLDAAAKLKKTNALVSQKKKKREKNRKKGAAIPEAADVVNDLIKKLEFKREVEQVDLTTDKRVATRLTETKVECLVDEKDYYVYYFCLR